MTTGPVRYEYLSTVDLTLSIFISVFSREHVQSNVLTVYLEPLLVFTGKRSRLWVGSCGASNVTENVLSQGNVCKRENIICYT